MWHAKLTAMEDSEIVKSAVALQINLKKDLSPEFPIQMVQITNTFREEIIKISTIKEFAELLLIKFATISLSFTEIITALLLFLTLPVTVATAERSFSKLKIIKNYLRNSMSEERLHNLSILGIEAKTAKSMDIKDIIRDCANLKSRKQNFNV